MRIFSILFLLIPLWSMAGDWQTLYEKSGFTETARYAGTVDFCKKLADASPWAEYRSFGYSPQGRELPLLIINKNGHFTPRDVRAGGQIVLYIQACIHAGEPDGKDAGLILLRDMLIKGQDADLLDHVTILFNPIFNVDGHERFSAYNRANQNGPKEMGWRTTAQNLNLNRDYLKADAPEMQAFLKLYNAWLPEFFIDCHVTDGADYQYAVTYKMEIHGIQDARLIDWTNTQYLPQLKKQMAAEEFPLSEYVYLRQRQDVQKGMTTWAAPPRFSDGYTAIQNRIGLLIETHMFKDYHTRVSATLAMLKNTLKILQMEYKNLRQAIAQADAETAAPEFRLQPLPLTWTYANDSSMIDFLGFEYHHEKSDLTGGDWVRFDDSKPCTFKIPFYNKMVPAVTVDLPPAYIIPPQWQQVIERLALHGVTMRQLSRDSEVEIDSYRFEDVSWQPTPYEGRQIAHFKTVPVRTRRVFPAGSVVVPINQRAAKVIANALEPQAMDSFVYWGFFNTIFERKEYVESYVMEEYARLMLASDARLKAEFEAKKAADSTFAADPHAILNWFYRQSPYWDQRKDVYPIGKIITQQALNELPLVPEN